MGKRMKNDKGNTKMENRSTRGKISLLRKSMTQFIICIAVLFALAAPAFYYLTKNYYAEDMQLLIKAIRTGRGIPALDMEEDIMAGIMLQYLLISALLATGTVVTMRLVAKKLWKPFDQTLESIESFRLENTRIPELPESDVKEFEKLNKALNALMRKNLDSYRAQKEFTENASHELQTPLAIFQAKLELLLQQPGLTGKQAEIIQELFQMTSRLSRLNRNLLLLAKIDNDQFDSKERIRLDTFIDGLLPALESISGHRRIESVYHKESVWVDANRILLESLLNNLIVNAVRHSNADGTITISIGEGSMSICNTSDEPALQTEHIFNRFYRTTQNKGGNGLGLAIVKAICDYHGWSIGYHFKEGKHCFTIKMTGQ